MKQTVTDKDEKLLSKEGQGSSPFLSYLFVTSTSYPGHDLRGDQETGLKGADEKCRSLAAKGTLTKDIKILGAQWTAFLADSVNDGPARFPHGDSLQVVNVRGEPLKESGKAFFGDSWPSSSLGLDNTGQLPSSLMSQMFLTEVGIGGGKEIDVNVPLVGNSYMLWTGMTPKGTSALDNCDNWGPGTGLFGSRGSTQRNLFDGWQWWSVSGAERVTCDYSYHFICILSPESL